MLKTKFEAGDDMEGDEEGEDDVEEGYMDEDMEEDMAEGEEELDELVWILQHLTLIHQLIQMINHHVFQLY